MQANILRRMDNESIYTQHKVGRVKMADTRLPSRHHSPRAFYSGEKPLKIVRQLIYGKKLSIDRLVHRESDANNDKAYFMIPPLVSSCNILPGCCSCTVVCPAIVIVLLHVVITEKFV
jgi:hypothetical protein